MKPAQIGLFVLCLSAAGAHAQQIAVGRVELRGPCSALVAELGHGPTRLECALGPSARAELRVPLLVPPAAQASELALLEPRLELQHADAAAFEPAARAVWLGWAPDGPLERWSDTPAGLRARPQARPPEQRVAPSLVGCAVLLALGCVALALGRPRGGRRAAQFALGLCGVACAWMLPPAGADAARPSVVFEIDAVAGRGLAWTRARDALVFDLERLAAARLDPPEPSGGSRLEARASGGPWTWHAPGARLELAHELSAGADALVARGGFERAWLRPAGGGWQRRGGAAGAEPPGWLLAGLPMGIDLALGRLARSDDGEVPGPWVRWSGPLDPRF